MPWHESGMARRDGRNWSWRWQRAVTAGPRRTVSRSQIAGPAADPFGRRFRIWTGPGVLCTPGRGFLPAPPLTAGLSRSGAQASTPGGGAVAVQDRTGEGTSCRVQVSSTLSRPWNGRPRGPLRVARPGCPPGKRVIAKPPLPPAPMGAPLRSSGGWWRRCSAALASRRARDREPCLRGPGIVETCRACTKRREAVLACAAWPKPGMPG